MLAGGLISAVRQGREDPRRWTSYARAGRAPRSFSTPARSSSSSPPSRCSSWLASEHSDGAFFGWSRARLRRHRGGRDRIRGGGRAGNSRPVRLRLARHVLGLGRLVRGPHRHPRRRRRAVRGLSLGPAALRPRDHHGVADPPCPLPVPPARATRGLHELVLRRRPRLRRGELVSGRVDHRRLLPDAGRRGRGSDYGFWIHFVAALAIGGGFIYLWRGSTWEWILIGLIALLFFLFAGGFDRSIYAVLGAIGLFLAWTYFVERWTDAEVSTPHRGVDTAGLHVRHRRAQRLGRRDAVCALRARARRDRPLARAAKARGSSPSLPSCSASLQLAA